MWQQRSCTKNNNKNRSFSSTEAGRQQQVGAARCIPPDEKTAHCNLPAGLDSFINGAKLQLTCVDSDRKCITVTLRLTVGPHSLFQI